MVIRHHNRILSTRLFSSSSFQRMDIWLIDPNAHTRTQTLTSSLPEMAVGKWFLKGTLYREVRKEHGVHSGRNSGAHPLQDCIWNSPVWAPAGTHRPTSCPGSAHAHCERCLSLCVHSALCTSLPFYKGTPFFHIPPWRLKAMTLELIRPGFTCPPCPLLST